MQTNEADAPIAALHAALDAKLERWRTPNGPVLGMLEYPEPGYQAAARQLLPGESMRWYPEQGDRVPCEHPNITLVVNARRIDDSEHAHVLGINRVFCSFCKMRVSNVRGLTVEYELER